MDSRFAPDAFERSSESQRVALGNDLAQVIEKRLIGAVDFHATCYEIVEELRRIGHDIWSFDESDDFQEWVPNGQDGVGNGLHLRLTSEGEVRARWVERRP